MLLKKIIFLREEIIKIDQELSVLNERKEKILNLLYDCFTQDLITENQNIILQKDFEENNLDFIRTKAKLIISSELFKAVLIYLDQWQSYDNKINKVIFNNNYLTLYINGLYHESFSFLNFFIDENNNPYCEIDSKIFYKMDELLQLKVKGLYAIL